LAVVLLVVFSGGWVGWKFYRNVAKVTHDSDPLSLLSVFHPTPIKSQNDWVNILVAGDSADRVDPGANGGNLTDSIMILSVNTQTKTGFMLSIPRDLWVDVPEEGWAKINSTYEFDGMSGLDQLVDTDFGIPIDYYALVNYQAFEDLVNAVGGIAVDIQSPDPRGLYDPQPYPGASAFKLANGWQTLDGLQALDLARARGDAYGSYGFPGSDFARTQHQRQMVLAIKDKITSSSVISNPLKLGQIADAIGNNVVTNLQLSQAEALYSLTKNINDSSVQSLNINTLVSGQNLLTRYAASNGESSLIPAAGVGNYSAIREAITKLMSNNPVVKESANIVVLNGGNIVGLAAAEGNILAAKGMDVSEVADAPQLYPTTTIINNSNGSDPNTKQALTALYGNNYSTNANLSADYPSADFIVILGENVTMPSGSTTSISQ
jgi:LCP family protein required for cell wall assembly